MEGGINAQPGYVCARCGRCGPGCCRMPLGRPEGRFPLSGADCARLAPYLSEDGTAGIESAPVTPELRKNLKRLFPEYRREIDEIFPLGGDYRRLRLLPCASEGWAAESAGEYGRCAYLGEDGCTVATPDRPAYCRLFPFWVSGKKLNCFASDFCLALREGKTIPELLTLFGVSPLDLMRRYAELKKEWGFHS